MIDKEEFLETEEKIEKALKKEQEQRQIAKEQKVKEDFAESEAKFLLEDKATELETKEESSAKKVSVKVRLSPQPELKVNLFPQIAEDEIVPKIKKVVEQQSEKILKQIPPIQPPATSTTSTSTANGSPKPKDKVI